MVAYSFKMRFARPIRSGQKMQTIRADRARHARPGENVQLYTAMRTKQCQLIARGICRDVRPIVLDFRHLAVNIPGVEVFTTPEELAKFARRDGFADWDELHLFWMLEHKPLPDRWSGVIVFWHELEPNPFFIQR